MTTATDLDALDFLIDTAGKIPTRIDAALAEATRVQALGNYANAQKQITVGHAATAEIGATLAAIQLWSTAQRKALARAPGVPNNNAPFGVDNYGRAFKTQEEADDYARRNAAWEAQGGGKLDAEQQATLQPGQTDITNMSQADLETVLGKIGDTTTSAQAFRDYGPTKLVHVLSALLDSGIRDAGNDCIVAPAEFPQLAGLTVDRAKALAGKG